MTKVFKNNDGRCCGIGKVSTFVTREGHVNRDSQRWFKNIFLTLVGGEWLRTSNPTRVLYFQDENNLFKRGRREPEKVQVLSKVQVCEQTNRYRQPYQDRCFKLFKAVSFQMCLLL